MIPKLIHQIWLDKNTDSNPTPPEKYLTDELCGSVKKHNSEYVHKFWNFSQIRELLNSHEKLRKYIHLFENMKFHIEKCDFARYAVLYIYGGIYVDCDYHAVASFDPILNRNIVMTEEPPGWVFLPWGNEPAIFNGFLASKKGHKFWIQLMDYILYTYSPNKTVMDNTGPIALGRLATKIGVYDNKKEYFVDMCLIRPVCSGGEMKKRDCDGHLNIGNYIGSAGTNWFIKEVAPSFTVYMMNQYWWVILLLLLVIIFILILVITLR
jgi:mannosyltransferase OCH1-like enzyme